MRLWSLHPKYLDYRGLIACWREALLARKVLSGSTLGYRHHPQLFRFRLQPDPIGALDTYLAAVYDEALRRGYRFDRTKIGSPTVEQFIPVTQGQLDYEMEHLRRKLTLRDPERCESLSGEEPQPHPLFRVVVGKIEQWEKL